MSKLKNNNYNPSEIEKKWQEKWEQERIYSPNLKTAKKPFYNLMMFPYPSAEGMHVGNMYAFTGADVYGRFMRMKGFNVFEPIGLDGFGIHSENYAIKVGNHPAEQAKISEKNFYNELKSIGNGFDWTRTVETYKPEYYKWTQWLFIQLFKAGLAYRKKAPVNFCPSCKTVLADEQVITKLKIKNEKLKITEDASVCERCETEVIKKDLEQWFFRITKYANRLLANIAKLDWSEKVRIAQRQWIGKKTGINIMYNVADNNEEIVCFTTTPVNFAATFIVLSPEHLLVLRVTKKEKLNEVMAYIKKTKTISKIERIELEREKTGVFTGGYAINHVTGRQIPIWVSDFVLMDVGTGAIQGCPGHDLRDFDFAKKFGLPIVRVIVGLDGDMSKITRREQVIEKGGIMVNSDFLNGLDFYDAMEKTKDYFEKKGWGKRVITYHLRDWLISRQRYWGPPIPMIYCQKCAREGRGWLNQSRHSGERSDTRIKNNGDSGQARMTDGMLGWSPVPEDQLPVLLPDVKDWKPKGEGKSPLANIKSFVNTKCPNCGGDAKRETDVSDNFLDSSWYFLRYVSSDIENEAFDAKRVKKWLPVSMYIGGAEHSVLHLLYSRFITMALYDLGFISYEEPFSRFYAHGLLIKEGAKMSKSKGNVVVPDTYIQKYGADSLRCYLMFLGPFNQGGDFYDTGIEGVYRFLKRVWRLVSENSEDWVRQSVRKSDKSDSRRVRDTDSSDSSEFSESSEHMMQKTTKRVTEYMKSLKYNVAIAALMEYCNFLSKQKHIATEEFRVFLKLLAPFAPHFAEELWNYIGEQFSIHLQTWPKFDESILRASSVTIAIQVNGKLRDTIITTIRNAKIKNQIEQLAKESDKLKKYLEGKNITRVVYVEGKVINFVTNH